MSRVTKGHLRIVTDSHVYIFPPPGSPADKQNPAPGLTAEFRVLNPTFWIRLCLMSDLGFAEAYMYGDAECDDLPALFKLFMYNKDSIGGLTSTTSYLLSIPSRLVASYRFLNTITNSRSNISAHYDISNTMFKGFLSEDLTYSCAIFSDLDADLKTPDMKFEHDFWSTAGKTYDPILHFDDPNVSIPSSPASPPEYIFDDLHAAQMRKVRHVISKAQIKPGHRVLEIGSGWGTMAITIARTIPGTQVDSLTLSVAQRDLAMERIRKEGLDDRIRIHLMDYRSMPGSWKGSFDRLVSVEMMEAVGREYMDTFWETMNWAMKPKSAVGVVQCITLPEARFDAYCNNIDFIQKWVFPGSFIPSLSFIISSMNVGASSQFTIDSISNIGPHYARTLREWRNSFMEKFESVIEPALKEEYPDVMTGGNGRYEIEVFRRKWIYYYCYCEAGFSLRSLGDHIITFTRDGSEDHGCNVYE
ncbi:CFS1-like protein [Thelephora ganbajun]|uniref:CFS1-like protein n=1 Tax=Thelephora ganbajun TaxID=370292 RepID=A0ACB6ZF45_THEGA|nr:CFS1-like protein [Thelephora ganbajun]